MKLGLWFTIEARNFQDGEELAATNYEPMVECDAAVILNTL